MSTSLFQLKAATEAGSAEQKRLLEKRRNVLVLVHQQLTHRFQVVQPVRSHVETQIVTASAATSATSASNNNGGRFHEAGMASLHSVLKAQEAAVDGFGNTCL